MAVTAGEQGGSTGLPKEMKTITNNHCPSCGEPLTALRSFKTGEDGAEIAVVHLYCSHGRCESQAANKGGFGATVPEALKALGDAVDAENQDRMNSL